MMKNFTILAIIAYFFAISSSFAAFTTNDDDVSTKRFSENQYGYGLSIAKEFEIENAIFTESGEDYLFNEIGVFYNHYDDVIDSNHGVSYSFGYGYGDFASYLSGGYVITDFEHVVNNVSKDYSEGAGFVGAGLSYKLNSYLKMKLDFMNYKFNFDSKTSSGNAERKNEVSIRSLNFGLQFYF